jgi:tetratricopeptide (TPR) repeat protein
MRRSLTAVLAVTAALTAFLLLGRRADPVYAQLRRTEAAIRQVRSVHFVGWGLGPDGRRVSIESWYARPYLSWGKRGDELSVVDGEREWRHVEGSGIAYYQPATELKAVDWQRLFDFEKRLERTRQGEVAEDLGLETVGATPLRKIRLAGEGYTARETWWLDPVTDLVRQVIREQKDGPLSDQWRVVSRSTRIEYDVTPPRGLFTFTPPPGVRVMRVAQEEEDQAVRIDRLLTDGQVLAKQKSGDTTVELLAFSRSAGGNLFAVWSVTPYIPWVHPILTDSAGGRYISFNLIDASQQEKASTTLFFRVGTPPAPSELTHELQFHLFPNLADSWVDRIESKPGIRFDHLTPRNGPALLDQAARETAMQRRGASLDFFRATALGHVALRQGRTAEAMAHLEDAVRRTSQELTRQMNPHEMHTVRLELAELYIKAGRPDDARTLLETLHRAVAYEQKVTSPALKAAEAMERLGEHETAARWMKELIVSREFDLTTRHTIRIAKTYERLSGDKAGARESLLVRLEQILRTSPVLGFGDGWDMAQAFEAAGRKDLALEAYTKALETTILKPYRESGGKLWREDTEKYIAQIRRLGGEEAVQRLTVRPRPPGE